ncbi:MAG: Hpt domain-containing protein [Methylococcales bacterium]|nr:Hpt domain-containing protein [Methylococcales bacterium]MDD5754083.1 Hpt domain-containing protein [Methylococcales bacterium]
MSVDMTQFHDVLFEECLENLDIMQKELNSIDLEVFNFEKMMTIYRGAHTIKGGCAMLEFNTVADYAKEMEHLLGQMRDKTKLINPDNINVMLESVEFLRAMIKTLQNKEVVDEATAVAHCAKMQAAIV